MDEQTPRPVPDPELIERRGLVTDVVIPIVASVAGGVAGGVTTVVAADKLKRPGKDDD